MGKRASLLILFSLLISMAYIGFSDGIVIQALETEGEIEISSEWAGPPVMHEDEGPYAILLSGPDGMINETISNVTLIEVGDKDGHYGNSTSNSLFDLTILILNGIWKGELTPHKDMSGNESVRFLITTQNSSDTVDILFTILSVNDPPYIEIPQTTGRSWNQDATINIRPIITDTDIRDQHNITVNMRTEVSGRYPSIMEQFPYYEPSRGIDWDINSTTGIFWWKIEDNSIWRTINGLEGSVDAILEFKVTDQEGEFDLAVIMMTLKSVDDHLDPPDRIMSDPAAWEDIFVGEEIRFWVDPITDPYGDTLTYSWDLGDGRTTYGIEVNHTYSKKGWRTVQMWVSDGVYASEKISYRLEISDGYQDSGVSNEDFDGDGVINVLDHFSTDPAASSDSDGDGYPEKWNPGKDQEDSTTGLKLDKYPDNADRNGYEPTFPMFLIWGWIILIPVILLVSIIITIFTLRKREGEEIVRESEDQQVFR